MENRERGLLVVAWIKLAQAGTRRTVMEREGAGDTAIGQFLPELTRGRQECLPHEARSHSDWAISSMACGTCKCEYTKDGVCITCTSGDKACCEMLQKCCDCLETCCKSGCCCYVCLGNTPICCGTCA